MNADLTRARQREAFKLHRAGKSHEAIRQRLAFETRSGVAHAIQAGRKQAIDARRRERR